MPIPLNCLFPHCLLNSKHNLYKWLYNDFPATYPLKVLIKIKFKMDNCLWSPSSPKLVPNPEKHFWRKRSHYISFIFLAWFCSCQSSRKSIFLFILLLCSHHLDLFTAKINPCIADHSFWLLSLIGTINGLEKSPGCIFKGHLVITKPNEIWLCVCNIRGFFLFSFFLKKYCSFVCSFDGCTVIACLPLHFFPRSHILLQPFKDHSQASKANSHFTWG